MWPFSTVPTQTAALAFAKQTHRDLLIAQALERVGLAEDDVREAEFLAATATEIAQNIADRRPGWSASAVMRAYVRASARAQKETNCLTEVMYADALDRAAELDNVFSRTGELVGPLHGVPCSFKDQFNIRGLDSTVGLSPWCNDPAEEDATLVRIVRAAGGVPFVKTNVPQTMLSFECSNPVWGRTTNPYGKAFTCGGSSGGEAALLASQGSGLGFGTDIGGSLRIPASYCGIYAIKGVGGRFPFRGARGVVPGYSGIQTCSGPMARSINDLELAFRVALASPSLNALDAEQPLPWRDELASPSRLPSKLRIGYFKSDGAVKASPVAQRAVEEVIDALRGEGHEVIEWVPKEAWRALQIFSGLSASDGYKTALSNLGNDPLEPAMKLTTMGPRLPSWLRGVAVWVLSFFYKDQIAATMLAANRPKSVSEYWQFNARRDAFADEVRKSAWIEGAFDAVICPVQATPALPHNATSTLSPLCIGTVLWNVVDSTVGVLPVTHVDPKRDALTPEWRVGNPSSCNAPSLERAIYDGGGPFASPSHRGGKVYDEQEMAGLPVGVQVVLPRWQEEKCLACMRVVEGALGKRREEKEGAQL